MKYSIFNVIIEYEGTYLLHNTLHDNIIRIYDINYVDILKKLSIENFSSNQLKDLDSDFVNCLIDNKFIIDDDFNEHSLLNYKFYINQRNLDTTLRVMIIPTRECNFRCPYCYENHENKNMTEDMFNCSLKFIEEFLNNNPNYINLCIDWFGGEPTLKINEICKFMNKLKTRFREINVFGSMTSNGYLLNLDNFKKLIDLGIVQYQITIDGLRTEHDSTRFLSAGSSTWKTIINNLLDLKKTELNFNILIRTNVTTNIMNNIDKWTKFLKANFGDDSRFNYHMEPVKNLGKHNEYIHPTEEGTFYEINNSLKKQGLRLNLEDSISPFGLICYASNPSHFTIDYDGSIKKCTVALDDQENNIGKICSENLQYDFNFEKLSKWTNFDLDNNCRKCSILPICYGRKCPNCTIKGDWSICNDIKYIYKDLMITKYLKKY